MSLRKLFELEVGDELSFGEAQEINRILASTCLADLPRVQLVNVKEYLEAAFAADSVKAEHTQSLSELLERLQADA